MLDAGEYNPVDWTLDLIAGLVEERGKDAMCGVSWRIVIDTLDVIGWTQGPVDDVIGDALDMNVLFESILGNLRLTDHEGIHGRGPWRIHAEIPIQSNQDRARFMEWVKEQRKIWDTRKAEPSLIDMRILSLP